ncbi:MAG: lamin tail domain-containing protein [Candidatus Aenigmatarchaeota archaeon]|nr:thermonuclease family protein [Nanoarchaeota archaeon]
MKKAILVIALLAVILLVDMSFTGLVSEPELELEEAFVTRVIDGDTVVLENDDHVRLLGMDTPEKGQYLYNEATEWLVERIENKTVGLERGVEDKDKYDRLLRYIYIDNSLVNIELVEQGLASAYIFEEDQHSDSIIQSELRAKERNLGIWEMKIDNAFCMGIHNFHYNAKGDDNDNLNDEYVTLRNKCTYPVQITGWKISDERKTTYTFHQVTVMNKTTITLHTGSGDDTSEDVYWDKTIAVWNNNGDTLIMLDSDGNKMIEYSY